MVVPSRDHTGVTSSAGLKVNRDPPPCASSKTQTSTLLALRSLLSSATRVPSGEIAGLAITPTGPTRPISLPFSSNHVSCDWFVALSALYGTGERCEPENDP